MAFRLSGLTRSLLSVVVLALVVTGCGLTGSDDPVASRPEPTAPGLLPAPEPQSVQPTPRPTVPPTAIPQAIEVSTTPTPIPTPEALSCLSTRRRVAQLMLPLVTQPELFGAQAFAQSGELGGIGLLGSPNAQLPDDLASLQQAAFLPVLVASDEEGGSVQRLTYLGPIPSAAQTAQSKTVEEVRREWVEYGSRVRDAGVDVVFGPVLDVGAGPGIESRSFSDDPAVVTAYGRAVAEGLLEAGVLPVFKHFPGHGRATADSHLELPTTPSIDEVRSYELAPYVELFADPVYQTRAAVMVGHLSVPGLSGDVPTSLSPEAVTGLLRNELGFSGLIFTDAINMGAIANTYGRLDALELALRAGADVIILGSLADLTPALDHLVMLAETDASFATIIDNRAARVLAAKGQNNFCTGAQ